MIRTIAFILVVLLSISPASPSRALDKENAWIMGPIGWMSLSLVSSKVRHARDGESLTIHINSTGGNLDPAVDLMNDIVLAAERGVRIRCVAEGLAASAAFFILESCPLRSMDAMALLMTHKASLSIKNPTPEQQLELFLINRRLAVFTARRMQLPLELYEALVDKGDWWMDSYSALALGAVDEIEGHPNYTIGVK